MPGELVADAAGLAHAASGISDVAVHVASHRPPACAGPSHQPTVAAVAEIHANVQQMATHYGDRLKGTSGKLDAASVAYAATDSTGAAGIAAVEV